MSLHRGIGHGISCSVIFFLSLHVGVLCCDAGPAVVKERTIARMSREALDKYEARDRWPLTVAWELGERLPNGNYLETDEMGVGHGVCGDTPQVNLTPAAEQVTRRLGQHIYREMIALTVTHDWSRENQNLSCWTSSIYHVSTLDAGQHFEPMYSVCFVVLSRVQIGHEDRRPDG